MTKNNSYALSLAKPSSAHLEESDWWWHWLLVLTIHLFTLSRRLDRSANWTIRYFITWWAGKVNQILRCDWLPEGARWIYLARSGQPAVSHKKKNPLKPYNKSFIDQACSVKIARYWSCSFFASLWTSTWSRSINTQKKRTWPISSHLDLTLVNNPYLLT